MCVPSFSYQKVTAWTQLPVSPPGFLQEAPEHSTSSPAHLTQPPTWPETTFTFLFYEMTLAGLVVVVFNVFTCQKVTTQCAGEFTSL